MPVESVQGSVIREDRRYAGVRINLLGMLGQARIPFRKGYRESVKRNMPKRWFDKLPHTHRALDDALEQGALFCNMLAENR